MYIDRTLPSVALKTSNLKPVSWQSFYNPFSLTSPSSFLDLYDLGEKPLLLWSDAFATAAHEIFGLTFPAPTPRNTALAEWCKIADLGLKIGPAYTDAIEEERTAKAVPLKEALPPFAITERAKEGVIPPTKLSSEISKVSPFSRIFKFDHVSQSPETPTFVIAAPNSGTAIHQMRDTVLAFLRVGNVRLVEQRDPHYVPSEFKNGMDDSTAALIGVLRDNPNAHLISISQSGTTAVVATALMFQNPSDKAAAPASLTVIGSPINAEIAPGFLSRLATTTYGEPPSIRVGPHYPGAGRDILPGHVPALYFESEPEVGKLIRQALPAEHIHDTLERVFRGYWLPKGTYRFHDQKVDPSAITCPVLTFAGAKDDICPPPQPHDLHRLTPNAKTHSQETLPHTTHRGLISSHALTETIVPRIVAVTQSAQLVP